LNGGCSDASEGGETAALRLAVRFLSEDLNILSDKTPKPLSNKPFAIESD
jgi:hypothetical protein